MQTIKGRVIKAVASKFFVDTPSGVKVCFARKKLKSDGNIFVGDFVDVAKDSGSYVIENVHKRKNALVRPYVSNIDVCFIVIAPEPLPDLILVDKIIVNCHQQLIEPVLVVNKSDLGDVDVDEYDGVVEIIRCSAESGAGTERLGEIAKGRTVCFAGQSAVGKSSLINVLLECDILEVGALAKRIKRGKNTTRKTEILNLGKDTYLVDTCGFSMLDTIDIPPEDLKLYYDDMEEYRPMCRFKSCQHIDEPDCAVKAHLGDGVGLGRYERYKQIYDELKKRKETKYD